VTSTLPGDLAASLVEAARRFGTPVAVTDVATLEADAAEVAAAFPDPWLRSFSVKANDVVGVVARLGAIGWGANVVSRGEWAVARRAGIPDARVTLEGVGKTDADLAAAVRSAATGDPLRWIAIESLDEARALVRLARRVRSASSSLDVLFRLNPDVEPETLRGLAVGRRTSKFGMAADELTEAVGVVEAAPLLVPRGIHLHVGSQLGAVDAWRDAVRRALALLALVRGARPAFDTLDVGGGFPVAAAGEPAPSPARFAAELPALLAAIPADRRPGRLAIEPGRRLVARAGSLVGRVLHARERDGRQVVIDVGMTEIIRPALYGGRHPLVALRHGATGGSANAAPTRVEGPVCESTDSFGVHDLPPLRRGDLAAILDTGAYAASLASTYNGRPLPPQILRLPDGSLSVARRRGTIRRLG
jgi:diaminopimelate decarboxylase